MSLILFLYKNTVSAAIITLLGDGCIYQPTCSEYTRLAFKKHGFLRASHLSLKRVLSCNGFSKKSHHYPLK